MRPIYELLLKHLNVKRLLRLGPGSKNSLHACIHKLMFVYMAFKSEDSKPFIVLRPGNNFGFCSKERKKSAWPNSQEEDFDMETLVRSAGLDLKKSDRWSGEKEKNIWTFFIQH